MCVYVCVCVCIPTLVLKDNMHDFSTLRRHTHTHIQTYDTHAQICPHARIHARQHTQHTQSEDSCPTLLPTFLRLFGHHQRFDALVRHHRPVGVQQFVYLYAGARVSGCVRVRMSVRHLPNEH